MYTGGIFFYGPPNMHTIYKKYRSFREKNIKLKMIVYNCIQL